MPGPCETRKVERYLIENKTHFYCYVWEVYINRACKAWGGVRFWTLCFSWHKWFITLLYLALNCTRTQNFVSQVGHVWRSRIRAVDWLRCITWPQNSLLGLPHSINISFLPRQDVCAQENTHGGVNSVFTLQTTFCRWVQFRVFRWQPKRRILVRTPRFDIRQRWAFELLRALQSWPTWETKSRYPHCKIIQIFYTLGQIGLMKNPYSLKLPYFSFS